MIKLLFAALALVASTAHAADTSKTETYKIDTKASSVGWKGFKKAGSSHHGAIAIKDGEVLVDKKGQLTSGVFNVDMATISNEDLKDSAEYQKKLVGHLSSADFFDVTKYPTSTFKLLSITPKEKGQVMVKGELTMIGKTNPIEFPAKITTAKGVVTGEAVVKVDRTAWGLKYGSGNFFKELTADKIISDEFELNLKLVAKK